MKLPAGMDGAASNVTSSIVVAFVSSGIPYAAVVITCKPVPVLRPPPTMMGFVAVYLPRLWMFILSLLTDVLLFQVFAVYDSEHVVSAVITYAPTWTTLVWATRNTNFALEALCVTSIITGCFGWPINSPRPLFWLSGVALSLLTFLRLINFFFVLMPLNYLTSL